MNSDTGLSSNGFIRHLDTLLGMEPGRLWLALTNTGWGEAAGLGNFAYAVRDPTQMVKMISNFR